MKKKIIIIVFIVSTILVFSGAILQLSDSYYSEAKALMNWGIFIGILTLIYNRIISKKVQKSKKIQY